MPSSRSWFRRFRTSTGTSRLFHSGATAQLRVPRAFPPPHVFPSRTRYHPWPVRWMHSLLLTYYSAPVLTAELKLVLLRLLPADETTRFSSMFNTYTHAVPPSSAWASGSAEDAHVCGAIDRLAPLLGCAVGSSASASLSSAFGDGEFANRTSAVLHTTCIELLSLPWRVPDAVRAILHAAFDRGKSGSEGLCALDSAALLLSRLHSSFWEETARHVAAMIRSLASTDRGCVGDSGSLSVASLGGVVQSDLGVVHQRAICFVHSFIFYASPAALAFVVHLVNESAPMDSLMHCLLVAQCITPALRRLRSHHGLVLKLLLGLLAGLSKWQPTHLLCGNTLTARSEAALVIEVAEMLHEIRHVLGELAAPDLAEVKSAVLALHTQFQATVRHLAQPI